MTTPKPLVKVAGRPILDHVFDALPESITEVIVVVKYLGDQIRQFLGNEYRGRKITCVEGSDKGNAYSFLSTRPHIGKEKFLVLYGDEFMRLENIKKCLAEDLSVITFDSWDPQSHGIAVLRSDGSVAEIVEKPQKPPSKIGVGGIIVVNDQIFNYQPEANSKGEYYFSSLLSQFVKDRRVIAIPAVEFWGDISVPADIQRIEAILDRRVIC